MLGRFGAVHVFRSIEKSLTFVGFLSVCLQRHTVLQHEEEDYDASEKVRKNYLDKLQSSYRNVRVGSCARGWPIGPLGNSARSENVAACIASVVWSSTSVSSRQKAWQRCQGVTTMLPSMEPTGTWRPLKTTLEGRQECNATKACFGGYYPFNTNAK